MLPNQRFLLTGGRGDSAGPPPPIGEATMERRFV